MAAAELIVSLLADTAQFETDTKRSQTLLQQSEKLVKQLNKTMQESYKASADFMGPLQPDKMRPVLQGVDNLTKSVQKSQAAFRGSNQIVQQASYQITDFVVQVSGGVSAMRAFSQQAPQLLAAFGGTGAVLGVIAALGGAAADLYMKFSGVKDIAETFKNFDEVLGSVASSARTFDMTPVIKQFNAADAATRDSIIQLMSYRKALIEVTNIDLRKAFAGQVSNLTDTGFLGQFSSAMPSEAFASKMGIDVNKQMYADLRVLRYEYGSVQEFADKYATTLVKGNDEGRKFAKTIIEMAQSLKEGEMATKAINEVQKQMVKAGDTGKVAIPGEKHKLTPEERLARQQAMSADKFIDSLKQQTMQLEHNKQMIGLTAQEVEVLNAQYKIQADLEKAIQDIERQGTAMKKEDLQKMKDAAAEATAAQTEIILAAQDRQRSGIFGLQSAMQSYTDSSMNMAKNVEGVFTNAFKGMENAIVNFAMTGKMNFKDFANSLIADIMRIYVRMALVGLLETVGGAALSGLTNNAMGPGFVGPRLPGKSEGGYTGDGGKYQPAGIVHAGEFVMTKEATSRIGVGNLYSMMRGYANGGYVGGSMPSGSSSGNVTINVKNEAGADGYQAQANATRNNQGGIDVEVLVRKALSSDIRNNGPMAQQMANTFGLRRSA